jgi:hypothetical protein
MPMQRCTASSLVARANELTLLPTDAAAGDSQLVLNMVESEPLFALPPLDDPEATPQNELLLPVSRASRVHVAPKVALVRAS